MQIIIPDERELYDLECIYLGLYSPLDGPMNYNDYSSTLQNMTLQNGQLWALPITLATDTIEKESVELRHPEGFLIGRIDNPTTYIPDIDQECQLSLGTTDTNHPYVKYLHQRNKSRPYYIGGCVVFEKNIPFHCDFQEYRLEKTQIRSWCYENPTNVVGFQTRNPMHKSHFHLTKYALSQIGDDGRLLITPAVGPTQQGDVNYDIRMKTYIEMLKEYAKENIEAKLAILPLNMRMAGPREAVHHALIRQTIGCSHFIVGRDHAGPSTKQKDGTSFYAPDAAHSLLQKVSDQLDIQIITSKMIVYSKNRRQYLTIDQVNDEDEVLQLSGTQQREYLKTNTPLPEWFTFPSINDILQRYYKKTGLVIYIYGLSGSGKSTFAKYLKSRLEEDTCRKITLLDGDIVRQELSKGLGFSKHDRSLNVRRIGYVASEIAYHGGICICANIAPYKEDRDFNKQRIQQVGEYVEILMNTPLEICEKRDVKGLYKKAREGIIEQFTGISDPFEINLESNFVLDGTHLSDLKSNVEHVVKFLHLHSLL